MTTSPPTENQSVVTYSSVPISTLHCGDKIPFSLYAQIQGNYLLQHREGAEWTEDKAGQLQSAGTNELWILSVALDNYLAYLQRWNSSILEDPNYSLGERIGLCYKTGTVTTREAITNPTSNSAYEAFEYSMEVAVQLLEKYKFSFSAVRDVFEQAPTLFSHSMQVCLYGLLLGRAVGYRPLPHLGMALAFHDAGKLDLPRGIFEKEGSLTSDEWQLAKSHAGLGVNRAKLATRLPAVARDVIQNHHERMDGSGYPRGLDATQLTVASRIAAIVNTFDSRTCHRPYREARRSIEVAKDMLAQGPAFDTELMHTFVRLLAT
ncbi:MAG: HD domain-containing phosphohydrolase [Planctomycetota bacterium]